MYAHFWSLQEIRHTQRRLGFKTIFGHLLFTSLFLIVCWVLLLPPSLTAWTKLKHHDCFVSKPVSILVKKKMKCGILKTVIIDNNNTNFTHTHTHTHTLDSITITTQTTTSIIYGYKKLSVKTKRKKYIMFTKLFGIWWKRRDQISKEGRDQGEVCLDKRWDCWKVISPSQQMPTHNESNKWLFECKNTF